MSLRAERCLDRRHTDVKWYRVAYNFALTERLFYEKTLKAGRSGANARAPKLEELTGELAALLLLIERATTTSSWPLRFTPYWPGQGQSGRALHPFLKSTMEPCTALLLAGVLLDWGSQPSGQTIRDREHLIQLLERQVADAPDPPDLELDVPASQGKRPSGESKSPSELQPHISADALVAYVENGGRRPGSVALRTKRIGWRTRFNLACYYSRRADHEKDESPREKFLARSLKELTKSWSDCPARERTQLIKSPRKDPALEALRDAKNPQIKQGLELLMKDIEETFSAPRKSKPRTKTGAKTGAKTRTKGKTKK